MPDSFDDFPQPILPPRADSVSPAAPARPKAKAQAIPNPPRQAVVTQPISYPIEVCAPPVMVSLARLQPQKSQLLVIGITVAITVVATLAITATAGMGYLLVRQRFLLPHV